MSKIITPITFDDLERLGLDEENQLYWDGNPIEIKKRISLNLWQTIATGMTVLSALSMAIFDALRFINGN